MKKNRNFNLKALLLLCLVIFSNCSNDENILEPIEGDILIETLSIDDAKDLFQDINSSSSLFSKSSGKPFVTPHLDEINQEAIENSEELITLIPSTTSLGENQNSRIVLLKIDGEIKSVVFNMIGTDQEDNEDFTGNIIVTELDGTFLNGYRVDKGQTVALLAKSESSKTNAKSNLLAKSNNNCPYSDPFWCSYYNSNRLSEVTITVALPSNNNSSYSSTYNRDFNTINILNLYSNNNSYNHYNTTNYSNYSYSWNYGGRGGSSISSSSSISTTLINTLNNSSNSSGNALTASQKSWISNYNNRSKVTSLNNYLKQNQYSSNAYEDAKGFVRAQVAIETLTDPKTIKLGPKNGKLNNRDDQEYTHFGTNGTYNVYQLKDGSRVMRSPWPLKMNTDGQLINDTSNQDTGESWYIKPAGETFWSNYLLKENINLSEELRKTALLTGTALAKAIGTYVLPIEDIKILITGSNFDGQQVSRYQSAGFLLLTVIPGSKALKVVGKASDAVAVVVKLGSNNLVVDTVKTGLKIVVESNIVKFLSITGVEIARIVNGVMTFKYAGFGGNIITNTNKTTTLLGRYADNTGNGTKALLDSKLFKFGENKGGFNLLDESTWNNLTQSQKDLLNYNWLEQAFQRGDDIRLVSDQTNKFSNDILTQYGKELNWIETFVNTYHYSYNSVTKTFIRI